MKEAHEYLLKNISENETVVAAISGGADSMALLDLLVKIKAQKNINVICTHVNHGVRKNSIKEEAYVKNYCQIHNVVFEVLHIKNYGDDNFHDEARQKRYAFFEKMVKKHNAKYLFTAHHADDLIETILMRLVRGSSLKGYAGFEEVTNKDGYILMRPLIRINKEEIVKYCKKNKIKFVTDESNTKDKYTRNRFRKYIIKPLKKECKNLNAKTIQFSESLLEAERYIEKVTSEKRNKLLKDNVIIVDKLNSEDMIIRKRIINLLLEQTYKANINRVNNKHVDSILKLIISDKNGSVNLPDGYIGLKEYNKFTLDQIATLQSYCFELTSDIKLPNGKTISFVKTLEDNNHYCYLSSKDIKLPLIVRNRQDGDSIAVKNLNGTRKVNDIFIDQKIDKKDRDLWPIVTDSDGNIVWLPGLKKTNFDKSKNETCDIILKYR